jgi:hypothetical protein
LADKLGVRAADFFVDGLFQGGNMRAQLVDFVHLQMDDMLKAGDIVSGGHVASPRVPPARTWTQCLEFGLQDRNLAFEAFSASTLFVAVTSS